MTPLQRHKAMAHNRGRTRPERALASGLWRRGIRYFTYQGYKSTTGQRLTGDPDIVLPRKRIVIFLDGCFWHGCTKCRRHEGLNDPSWIEKIRVNKERDLHVTKKLTDEGWTVFRVPEHDVRTKTALSATIDRLVQYIRPESTEEATLNTGGSSV